MTSLALTPKRKRCSSCNQAKGSSAFIKSGEVCTKCRNGATNPRALKSSGWSCFSTQTGTPQRSILQSPQRPMSEDSSLNGALLSEDEAIAAISTESRERSTSEPLESNLAHRSSEIETKSEIDHKIDLILESTLEVEKKQTTQVDLLRDEMQKVVLHLVEKSEEEKEEYIDRLANAADEKFDLITQTISDLRHQVASQATMIREAFEQELQIKEAQWLKQLELQEAAWCTKLGEIQTVSNDLIAKGQKEWQEHRDAEKQEFQDRLRSKRASAELEQQRFQQRLLEEREASRHWFQEQTQKLEDRFDIERQSWIAAQGRSEKVICTQIELLRSELNRGSLSVSAETYRGPPASPSYAKAPSTIEAVRGPSPIEGDHSPSRYTKDNAARVDGHTQKGPPSVSFPSRPASPFSGAPGVYPPSRPASPFPATPKISLHIRPPSPFAGVPVSPRVAADSDDRSRSERESSRAAVRRHSLASNETPGAGNPVTEASRPSTPYADLESPKITARMEPPKVRAPMVKPPMIKIAVRPPVPPQSQ